MKRRMIAFGAALCALCLLSGCGPQKGEPAPELLDPVGVKTDSAVVTRGDLTTLIAYEGAVTAQSAALSFEVDGILDTVTIYPGMYVHKGDTLLSLDQSADKARMDALEAQITSLQTAGAYEDELRDIDIQALRVRLQALEDSGAGARDIALLEIDIEQAELEKAQAIETRALTLQSLQAEYDALEATYGRSVITAPFDGHVIYDGTLKAGMSAQAYKAIIYLANPNDLRLITSTYLSDARVASVNDIYALIGGKRYEVTYDPLTREEMTAAILAGRSLTSRFIIEDPEGVEAGQYGALCLESGRVEDALTIPSGAIYSSAGSKYVYVLDDDGQREKRFVEVGRTNGVDTVIVSGLEEGETVYVKE